jgi:hypothetical protein
MVNHSLPLPPIISFLTAFISLYSTKLKRFATKLARPVKGVRCRARVRKACFDG